MIRIHFIVNWKSTRRQYARCLDDSINQSMFFWQYIHTTARQESALCPPDTVGGSGGRLTSKQMCSGSGNEARYSQTDHTTNQYTPTPQPVCWVCYAVVSRSGIEDATNTNIMNRVTASTLMKLSEQLLLRRPRSNSFGGKQIYANRHFSFPARLCGFG